ncbi:putative holin-like toxin [Tumebacillus sp. DT12]|uniref:Holin-like toxin n=1 Tax=Tumebacillus lacus TaxID=2995335 RepID=A0ABT3X594_9BACL|nr:putative holin-like toxin [Tumebacillus lacus]MCX7572071.1 putative holin-like toxin [Tumebacillus lacus]
MKGKDLLSILSLLFQFGMFLIALLTFVFLITK